MSCKVSHLGYLILKKMTMTNEYLFNLFLVSEKNCYMIFPYSPTCMAKQSHVVVAILNFPIIQKITNFVKDLPRNILARFHFKWFSSYIRITFPHRDLS